MNGSTRHDTVRRTVTCYVRQCPRFAARAERWAARKRSTSFTFGGNVVTCAKPLATETSLNSVSPTQT
jgi:hypothetical protein